jgi:transcription-repair coupling factor (superfamily II helicase)
MYQRLAAVRTEEALAELRDELQDRYGDVPAPVANLIAVARFRNRARSAGLTDVTLQGTMIRFGPVELPDSRRLRLDRLHPKSVVKQQLRTILVPRPTTRPVSGEPLRDVELLQWCTTLIDDVIAEPAVAGVRA